MRHVTYIQGDNAYVHNVVQKTWKNRNSEDPEIDLNGSESYMT
jgi:hypothetical protein